MMRKKTRTEKQDAAIDKAMLKRLADSGLLHSRAFTMTPKDFSKKIARLKANR